MEKIHAYTADHMSAFSAYKQRVLSANDDEDNHDEGFSKLSIKLEAALASKTLDQDDGVVKLVSKKAMKRKVSRAARIESKASGQQAHWMSKKGEEVVGDENN